MVTTGENRVLRGGSWINNGRNVRSAYRNTDDPSNRNRNYGLRLARAREQRRMTRFGPDHYPVQPD
ncbi:MAG: SUMF1/EgtB/PvdO family nonheme iron enzyme [Gammaproteobacteria bacterium]|nr:SUMF1/EgtB/PvdO family nonheme iron enzyme [Gammaproteobacteria bacterium]